MKSTSTLIALHNRAACVLELLQKAKDRVTMYKDRLKLWDDRHRAQWVHGSYRNRDEIVAEIITANRVYCRIKAHYIKFSKQIQIA